MSAPLSLAKAFRLNNAASPKIAFVGAGGKSTALFRLARELAPCIVTTTTHLGTWQAAAADKHLILHREKFRKKSTELLDYTQKSNVILITGEEKDQRLGSLSPENLHQLEKFCTAHALPLLIEADGARKNPLKAPKADEPVVPDFVDLVVVVAGLSELGKKLNKEAVYNAEKFAELGKMKAGDEISPDNLTRVLAHEDGGLKNIPTKARKVALLTQADTPKRQAIGKKIAEKLLDAFDSVIVTTFQPSNLQTSNPANLQIFEPASAILLAAGASSRFGASKQLLDYHGTPFVRTVAEKALQADLSLVVVTGAEDAQIRQLLADLPLKIIYNPDWREGQSATIRAGVEQLPPRIGSAIFLLADQPQVTPSVMRALITEHRQTLNPVIAPLVDGKRATPVLFDRVTFPALLKLRGDTGGRGIFAEFPPSYLHWSDTSLLLDVDNREDYKRLLNL